MKKAILLLVPLTLVSSCVSYQRTVDEKLVGMKFSSSEAARIFYETHIIPPRERTGENNRVLDISVGLPYSHRMVPSEHKKLNASFRRADSNCNGTVTLNEAQAYAAKYRPDCNA
jgi:hypothetical protein